MIKHCAYPAEKLYIPIVQNSEFVVSLIGKTLLHSKHFTLQSNQKMALVSWIWVWIALWFQRFSKKVFSSMTTFPLSVKECCCLLIYSVSCQIKDHWHSHNQRCQEQVILLCSSLDSNCLATGKGFFMDEKSPESSIPMQAVCNWCCTNLQPCVSHFSTSSLNS